MFLEYYGLNDQPFGVTPDPKYLFWGDTHREAVASLYYGIESGCGFMTLIAPPGMGKTTLLFHLLDRLGDTCRTAYIFETQCNSSQLLRYLMADLGCDSGEQDRVTLYSKLYELLITEARAGKRFVLIVDEAQNLDDSVLETVRLLSNFETPSRKLMQVLLAGQPQLSEKLDREELSQLRQRISIMSRIHPLGPPEVAEYIGHRLKIAGCTRSGLFTAEALHLIAAVSQGIPRKINNLCFNALSLGFAERTKTIDAPIVREAICDLQLELPGSPVPTEDSRGEIAVAPPDVSASTLDQPDPRRVFTAMARVTKQLSLGFGSAVDWFKRQSHLRNHCVSELMARRQYAAIAVLSAGVLLFASYLISAVYRVATSSTEANLRAASSAPVSRTQRAEIEDFGLSGLRTRLNGSRSTRYFAVTVRENENLDFICRKYLGRRLDRRILGETKRLNPKILNPDKLETGERVCLPLSWARISASQRRGTSEAKDTTNSPRIGSRPWVQPFIAAPKSDSKSHDSVRIAVLCVHRWSVFGVEISA